MDGSRFIRFAVVFACLSIIGSLAIPSSLAGKPAFAVSVVSTSTQFFGPALEKFLILDSSKTNSCDTITVHVKAARGSTSLFEQDVTLANIGTSGQFELFVTTANPPMKPANPTYGYNLYNCLGSSSPFIVRVNSAPVLGNTHEVGFALGAANPFLKDGDTIMVSYMGQSVSVQFAKSIVVASGDRVTAGDGDYVIVRLSDQDASIDPTAIVTFPALKSVITATGGTLNLTKAVFVEEGQGSGLFDLRVLVSSGHLKTPFDGATLGGALFPSTASFTLHDFDVYPGTVPKGATAPYNKAIANPNATSTYSVILNNTDGSISLLAPVSLANGVSPSISDQDMNRDTMSKDFLPAGTVAITMDGLAAPRGAPGNLWTNTGANAQVFQETDVNTGIFQPTLVDQAIPVKATSPGTAAINSSGVFIDPATLAANNNLYVEYRDPHAVPNGPKLFQLVTTATHVPGDISTTTPFVGLKGTISLKIEDPDLITNKESINSFSLTFDTANSGIQNPSQRFLDGLGALTLRVSGHSLNFSGHPMGITFIETGIGSSSFVSGPVSVSSINSAFKATFGVPMNSSDVITFEYLDHSENPVHITIAKINIVPISRNHVITTVAITHSPFSLAYDPANQRMYVANQFSNIVSVVSSSTNKVIASITFPTGTMPRAIAYVPLNHMLYVSNEAANYLWILDASTSKIVGKVIVGSGPEALVYDYHNQKLYVANYGSSPNGTISVVDVHTNLVVATVTVGFEPQFAAFDQAHGEIFIGMPSEHYVTVISDSTNNIVKNIVINAGNTTGVAYNPDNQKMYVTEPFLKNSVLVIDGETNSVVGNITVGRFPSSVAYDPANKEMYVTNQLSNSVSLISSSFNKVVDTVSLAGSPPPYLSPTAIAFDPFSGHIYTANSGADSLSVISSFDN